MSNKPKVAAIVAMEQSRVSGLNGSLPWHVPADMAHFKALTSGHVVVMGRKTWDSLPQQFRPLPRRTNLVVSRNPAGLSLPEGVLSASSPEAALELALQAARPLGQSVWIIGGAELYRALLPVCDQVHLTVVAGRHTGDAWLPEFEDRFKHISSQTGEGCVFHVYERKA